MNTVRGKIVVLGSHGVGKTSVVVRYIGNSFNQNSSPTVGASYFTSKVIVNNMRVKLQIWDTAGQERFRSMAPMYYRKACAALLVFDITEFYSFTCIKHWVDGEYNSISLNFYSPKELQRNHDEPILLCVIGNKTDLSQDRKVSREEACEYTDRIGGYYFECSAASDQGIESIFWKIAAYMVELSKDPLCSTINIEPSSDALEAAQKDDEERGKSKLRVSSPVTTYWPTILKESRCCF